MKKLLFIFCLLITVFTACMGQAAKYGAAVGHRNNAPTQTPTYSYNPSLMEYDYANTDLYVNIPNNGWWLLHGINERYIRGFINISYGNDQFLNYSFIQSEFQNQAGSGKVLHGFYMAKFTANSGNVLDICTVENLPLAPPTYINTHNDILLFRYYKGALVAYSRFDDKSNVYFQSKENTINILRDSVKLLNDTAGVHRTEINLLKNASGGNNTTQINILRDSVKLLRDTTQNLRNDLINVQRKTDTLTTWSINEKNFVYIPMNLFKCNEQDTATSFSSANYNTRLIKSHYFAVPPAMVGDTIKELHISLCEPSNYDMVVLFARLLPDGTVQNILTLADRRILANATHKTFTNVLVFSQHNGVLLTNDRILLAVYGYERPSSVPLGTELILPYGLNATMTVKPKSQ